MDGRRDKRIFVEVIEMSDLYITQEECLKLTTIGKAVCYELYRDGSKGPELIIELLD